MLQQRVNFPGALAGIGVLDKRPHLVRGRQAANRVDGDAAQEFRVAGKVRRNDVEIAQLREDFVVDVISFRQRWILPRRQLARSTIELAMKQGDLRSDLDVDTVIDTLYAPIYYRLMFETGPISDAYADGLYQSVIKGYGTSKHPKGKR